MLAPRFHPALMVTPIVFAIAYFIALKYYLDELRPITDEVRLTIEAEARAPVN